MAAHPQRRGATDVPYQLLDQPMGTLRRCRIIIVGCGSSGICMMHRLKTFMKDVEWICYEKNEDVSGTWFENRYPGARCDVPSVSYQFSWAPSSEWTEYYSCAKEIHDYMKSTAETFGLLEQVKLQHEVTSVRWNAQTNRWHVEIKPPCGPIISDTADFLVNATGILNAWKWPKINGLNSYEGKLVHTARYPPNLKLDGLKVAVIGTGSTAVQVIPTIAPTVKSLTAFIRSSIWVTPGFAAKYAGPNGANFLYSEEQRKEILEDEEKSLIYRKGVETEINVRFRFAIKTSQAQKDAVAVAKEGMIRMLQGDPKLCEMLIPSFGVGCRRPTPGNGFLEALMEPHVHACLDPIQRMSAKGIVTKNENLAETEHEFDVIICATGFDTSFRPRFPVVGRDGINLQDKWADHNQAESYMSVSVAGMPNYFMYGGPSYPAAHGSLLPVNELIANYICTMIYKWQLEPNLKWFEPDIRAQTEFNEHRDVQLATTVWSDSCSSWFKAGIGGKIIALHPGSRTHFMTLLKNPRMQDYHFEYEGNRFAFLRKWVHDAGDRAAGFGLVSGPKG
ncbi:FAD/NAD(P)-binding domain-containing protein [Mycena sanguinolenta]|uniref:FAD/NAD(P)-binding domain-containing protein n=1 Tax=Mycena sanguinolenta TaxID=230812 RepID=A0A8H7CTC0_9AGAR|nr:FAD/NAD(P)-binding domain-containing protein [Mycena sanguinolenta]